MFGHADQARLVKKHEPMQVEPLVVVVIGPWGAGKTTILNRITEEFVTDASKLGVIFAEFGEVNVDSARIQAERKIEVKDRCICCFGAEALGEAIQSLRPDCNLILVETSGVSNGSNVKSVLDAIGARYSILGVVNSADFSPEDTIVLDAQVPVTNAVVLTHNEWIGATLSLEDPKIEGLQQYLVERRGAGADAFTTEAMGIPASLWVEVERRAILASRSEIGGVAERIRMAQDLKHKQQVITVLPYPNLASGDIENILLGLVADGVKIKRAKGVIPDSTDRRVLREFDLVADKDESGNPIMKFTLGGVSRSDLFGKRAHMVLCGLDATSLSHDRVLVLGLPDLSTQRLEKAFCRYPNHSKIIAQGKGFPVYSNEGDRYYGVLSAIIKNIDQVPEGSDGVARVVEAWRRVVHEYLAWRAKGIVCLRSKDYLDPQSSYHEPMWRLSSSLLWHLTRHSKDISDEDRSKLAALSPAALFFQCCGSADRPFETFGSREYSPIAGEMLISYASYGIQNEGLSTPDICRQILNIKDKDSSGTWERPIQEIVARL